MEACKEYFAFISYKREDEKWAELLQTRLEHFKFPTNLNGRSDLPKHIRPIFRDVTDLSSGLLSEEINIALRDSEWLILICSPRSANSPWVCKEAQTFIDLGKADHIIPFIIEGSPFSNDPTSECYPESLLKLTGSNELLATNINELGRDAAIIKVVARMFNLRFDTLWQRHNREIKRKRIKYIAVGILALMLSLSATVYLLYNRRTIREQYYIIEEQYKEIKQKNEEVSLQKQEIIEKNIELNKQRDSISMKNAEILERNKIIIKDRDQLLISQSKYLASLASQEYDKGNVTKAIRLALYALPANLIKPDRPYAYEAEQILRKSQWKIEEGGCVSILRHGSMVNTAEFSHDGKYIVTGSWDNTAQIWNATTGRSIAKPMSHGCWVECAAFSSDGKYVATVDDFNVIRIWDSANCELVSTLKNLNHIYPIDYVEFSENNECILVSSGKAFHILDISKDSVVFAQSFECKGILDALISAKFSSNSKYVITKSYHDFASRSMAVHLWDIQKEAASFKYYDPGETFADIRQDNKHVAISSDDVVFVLDIQTNSLVMDPIDVKSPIRSVTYSPDGNFIATSSDDGIIRIWDASNGKCISETIKYETVFDEVVFGSNSDNYSAISYSDHITYVWDIKTGEQLSQELKYEGFCTSNSFRSDLKRLVTHSEDGTVRLYDFVPYQQISHTIIRQGIKFSPDSKYAFGNDSESSFVIDLRTGVKSRNYDYNLILPYITPCGKYLIESSNQYTFVFDFHTLELVSGTQNSGNVQIGSERLNTTKNYVLTICSDNSVNVWDIESGNHLIPPLVHSSKVNSAEFNSNGDLIVTGSEDGMVRIWDLQSGNILKEIYGHSSSIKSVAFSPDGKKVVSTSDDRTSVLWDVSNGWRRLGLMEHDSPVEEVVFSPDGKMIVTICDGYNRVDLWDLSTFKTIAKSMNHEYMIGNITFSPDSKYLITTQDNTAFLGAGSTLRSESYFNILDTSSGNSITNFIPYDSGPAQFDGDGNVVTISLDLKAKHWCLPDLQELIDLYLMDEVNDWSLTQEEKDEFNLE